MYSTSAFDSADPKVGRRRQRLFMRLDGNSHSSGTACCASSKPRKLIDNIGFHASRVRSRLHDRFSVVLLQNASVCQSLDGGLKRRPLAAFVCLSDSALKYDVQQKFKSLYEWSKPCERRLCAEAMPGCFCLFSFF